MEFHLSEAFVVIDSSLQHNAAYIRVTMFEERRIIRNQKSEKFVFVMKVEILKEAVFAYLPTRTFASLCYGLN